MNEVNNDQPSVEKSSSDKFDPRKTAKGCPECGYPIRMMDKNCPQCGHEFSYEKQDVPVEKEPAKSCEVQPPVPVAPVQGQDNPELAEKACVYCKSSVPETAHFCPNCGVPLANEHKKSDETVMPWIVADQVQTPECSLTFVPRDAEPQNVSTICFSGNLIQLSRGNTEPSNQTITSKVQAELSFENDKWYIQDKSALRTTYIYAGEKIELKQGDVIVLGNRLFEFNCDSKNPSE
jgi:RNA polymerase subunit RPABC4/transcription elongation factor Spt4